MEVLGSMTVGARVATAYVAAYEAFPKMNPPVTGLQTLLAVLSTWLYVLYLIQVCAARRHFNLLLS
jgi:cytochrome c-type biogenesis protein CcmH/NrfF